MVSGNDGRTLFTGYMPYLVTGGVATTLAQNEIGTVLGGISDFDVYQARVAEGTVLQVSTSTPLTGPGQPGNPLDPLIRLYGPDGTLLAEDDNSGADGVNASLSYTVPAGGGGLYFIEVRASGATPAPTRGEYVLTVQGGGRTACRLSWSPPPPRSTGPPQRGAHDADGDLQHQRPAHLAERLRPERGRDAAGNGHRRIAGRRRSPFLPRIDGLAAFCSSPPGQSWPPTGRPSRLLSGRPRSTRSGRA